jgi:hypothetical protein
MGRIPTARGKQQVDSASVAAVDKPSDQEFFTAIVASNILAPYLETNPDLAELIQSPNHPDIHYFEKPSPAKEIAPSLKSRLAVMTAKKISHNFEATKQLVAFMEEYPESQIYNVTFNCPMQHYGVRCALVDDQVRVICAMTGGHIPNELLGESNQ